MRSEMIMKDLDQKDRGHPKWEEEDLVPAQQGCQQLVTSLASPEYPF